MNSKQVRVMLSGGGTGGHIFPAIAIANAVRRLEPTASICFVGARGKMEMDLVPKAGYEIVGLDITGFQRGAWWKNLALPYRLLKSLREARGILKSFRPQVVIGTGGYASFPLLWTAERHRVPVLIQEQNSVAGKANRVLSRRAEKVCVAYEGMEQFFAREKIVLTGNPVRQLVTGKAADREKALLQYGLDPGRKTVLAIGGSLGAKSINDTLLVRLQEFIREGVQMVWQTGKLFYTQASEAARGHEKMIRVFDFIEDMNQAYQAADVVISRAGALAISELCLLGKPSVLVPYPYAAGDHQTRNSAFLVHHDAALMVRDNEAGAELVKKTFLLLENEKMQEILSANMLLLGRPDADIRIAKEALELVELN